MRTKTARRAARATSAVGIALTIWLAGTNAEASPQDIFGFGPRTIGMGATGAASATGADATWANPALLSLGRTRELSVGYQYAYLDLYAQGGSLPGAVHPEPMRGTTIGASLPLPFGGVLKDRIAVGLGFFTPTNVVVRARVLYPETPQFALLGDRMQSVTAQAGIGVDIGYGIRLGVGFSALAAVSGTVGVATDASGAIGTKVDDQLVASYAKILGISYDIGDSWRIGVTYRGVLEARFAVTVTVQDLGSLVVPPLNIAGLAQYDPWQVAIEAAHVRGPVRFAAGITFKRWSQYPGAPEPTVLCPATDPGCTALTVDPAGYHDTIVPRVGVEGDIYEGEGFKLTGRGGYFYERTPSSEQTAARNYFDNSRHVFSLGYSLAMKDPLPPIRLDWFAQLHELVERTNEKEPGVASTNAAFPVATTGGHIFMGGIAGTVTF